MKEATFKAYPSKLQIVNKNTTRGSSQNIRLVLDDIEISDYDLTLLKNLSPDGKIKVMIKPVNKQLSITDIEEEREKNKREKYKIL